jgi:uncharacterized membrane protein
MKILITGVAGLIGSRLADYIIENHPDFYVVGMDDLSGGYKENVNPKLIWLPILVFIGSGLIDIAINASNQFYIKSSYESALFSICTFLSAFIVGIIVLMYLIVVKKGISFNEVIAPKNILGGLILGVPNYFSIYFIFKSLDANLLQSAQLFPVLNLSNVALSAFLGWAVLKEKLSVINITGIALAIISILLISF